MLGKPALWEYAKPFMVEFSLPQIEYPQGGSSKKGSHVYLLLIVAMVVLLLWHQIVLFWHQVTMVASEKHLYQTIVLPRKLTTGSIYTWLPFLLLSLSGYSIRSTENCWPKCRIMADNTVRWSWESCDWLVCVHDATEIHLLIQTPGCRHNPPHLPQPNHTHTHTNTNKNYLYLPFSHRCLSF